MIAVPLRRIFDTEDDFGKKRIRRIRRHHSEHFRLMRTHTRRGVIRRIAEIGCGAFYLCARTFADARISAQHAGNGIDGKAGLRCNL